MNQADIEYQAEKLRDYIARGGDREAWFRSKSFTWVDRRAIERALESAAPPRERRRR